MVQHTQAIGEVERSVRKRQVQEISHDEDDIWRTQEVEASDEDRIGEVNQHERSAVRRGTRGIPARTAAKIYHDCITEACHIDQVEVLSELVAVFFGDLWKLLP